MSAMRATERLTRTLLVLAPARGAAGWRTPMLAAALVASVFVASHVHRDALPWAVAPPAVAAGSAAAPAPDLRPWQQRVERAELALQLSRAHAQELERQVDALNQRLREVQEELAFFRKTREGKRQETR